MARQLVTSDFITTEAQRLSEDRRTGTDRAASHRSSSDVRFARPIPRTWWTPSVLKVMPFLALAIASTTASTVPSGDRPSSPRGRVLQQRDAVMARPRGGAALDSAVTFGRAVLYATQRSSRTSDDVTPVVESARVRRAESECLQSDAAPESTERHQFGAVTRTSDARPRANTPSGRARHAL